MPVKPVISVMSESGSEDSGHVSLKAVKATVLGSQGLAHLAGQMCLCP